MSNDTFGQGIVPLIKPRINKELNERSSWYRLRYPTEKLNKNISSIFDPEIGSKTTKFDRLIDPFVMTDRLVTFD